MERIGRYGKRKVTPKREFYSTKPLPPYETKPEYER